MDLLHRDIAEPLEELIGASLERVVYHPLKGECIVSELNAIDYIGGEITLHFKGISPRYISWAGKSGWDAHYTLKVSLTSAFIADALDTFDACDADLWRGVIGEKLAAVECLGWNRSPHVLKLTLGDSIRLIGTSYQRDFGDGDDLYFCGSSRLPNLESASLLWTPDDVKQRNEANSAAPGGSLSTCPEKPERAAPARISKGNRIFYVIFGVILTLEGIWTAVTQHGAQHRPSGDMFVDGPLAIAVGISIGGIGLCALIVTLQDIYRR